MGTKHRVCLVFIMGLFGLAACAGTGGENTAGGDEQQGDTNRCLFARTINNFEVLDDSNLIVWAPSRRDPYKIEIMGICHNLKLANAIAFNTNSLLCGYAGERLVFSDMGSKTTCPIATVSRLTTQQMNSLLVQYGKKPICSTEEEKSTAECAEQQEPVKAGDTTTRE
jgi:hypothetical protein